MKLLKLEFYYRKYLAHIFIVSLGSLIFFVSFDRKSQKNFTNQDSIQLIIRETSNIQERQMRDTGSNPLSHMALSRAITNLNKFETYKEKFDTFASLKNRILPKNAAKILSEYTDDQLTNDSAIWLFNLWSMLKPQDAASWASSIESSSTKEMYLKLSIHAWTPQNIYESLDFVQNLPNDRFRETLLNLICEAATENYPIEALNIALKQTDEDKRKINIQKAVAQWAKLDPVNAFGWVLKIENLDLRNNASLHAAEAATWINPIAAAQFSITHMESNIYQDHILKLAIDQWSKKDPRSTAFWIMEFEYSDLSLASIEILARNWMAKDSTEYELWLKDLPLGDFRTEAINQFNQMRHSED